MKSVISSSRLTFFMSWITVLILVFLPFHAFFTSWAGNNFGHLDLFRIWKEILIALLMPLVLLLAWSRSDTEQFLKTSKVVRLYLAYIVLYAGWGAWALHRHNVNKTALIYGLIVDLRFIGFFLMTYIIASHSPFLKKNAVKILIIPAAIVAVVGILQKLDMPQSFLAYFYGKGTIPPYQTIDSGSKIQRLQSTLRGPNPLGAYSVLAVTAFAGFIKQQYLRFVAIAATLVVLFYSYSRSGWIGALISLWLLAWWMLLKSHHKVWLVSSIIAIVVLTGGSFYFLRSNHTAQDTFLHTNSSSKAPTSSNEVRLASIKDGVRDVIHEPLGRGPGTAGPASFRNKPHETRIAENYYLQIGQEVGVLGMAIFIAINVLVAKELWYKRRDLLAKVLLASLVGITFVNLLSHAWADDTLGLLWWGLAGICLAPDILASRTKAKNAKIKQKKA
jgi:hypothetical protein